MDTLAVAFLLGRERERKRERERESLSGNNDNECRAPRRALACPLESERRDGRGWNGLMLCSVCSLLPSWCRGMVDGWALFSDVGNAAVGNTVGSTRGTGTRWGQRRGEEEGGGMCMIGRAEGARPLSYAPNNKRGEPKAEPGNNACKMLFLDRVNLVVFKSAI